MAPRTSILPFGCCTSTKEYFMKKQHKCLASNRHDTIQELNMIITYPIQGQQEKASSHLGYREDQARSSQVSRHHGHTCIYTSYEIQFQTIIQDHGSISTTVNKLPFRVHLLQYGDCLYAYASNHLNRHPVKYKLEMIERVKYEQ
jgi:hypothetical protein